MSKSDSTAPVHPGTMLQNRLDQLGLPRAQIARLLGLSRQTLHDILAANQSITPSVALRVAKMTGTNPEMWLDMQQRYDLALARTHCAELLENVPVLDERW